MSVKSYIYKDKKGHCQKKWYFAVRYKDSQGYVHQRKGTGFKSREACELALLAFRNHMIYLTLSYSELLRFYRENIDFIESLDQKKLEIAKEEAGYSGCFGSKDRCGWIRCNGLDLENEDMSDFILGTRTGAMFLGHENMRLDEIENVDKYLSLASQSGENMMYLMG